jgi:copper chaperone CopZ
MACVATVTPVLNEIVGADNWSVDIQTPTKPLTVNVEDTDAEVIVSALAKVGYKADCDFGL